MAIGYLPSAPKVRANGRPRDRIIVTRPDPATAKQRAALTRRVTLVCLAMLLCGVVGTGVGKLQAIARSLPSIANLSDTRSHPVTRIVSSDGVLLATFETHYRRPVALEKVSKKLIDATLATEDARFYAHSGIDVRGIARALVSNVGHGNWVGQGGSTITQQLARNLYLSNRKTVTRKIEEIFLARKIEQRYSKHDILEAYLNTVYYGNGCYGAEAASRAYFHKAALDLDLGEAALLAGLPQRPAAYSPTQHLRQALGRRTEVLQRMVATGDISEDEAARTDREPVRIFAPHMQGQSDWKAPYFVAYVLNTLREREGGESLYSGMRIITTLNWKIQKAAAQSLHEGLRRGFGPNTGALVSVDPRSGAIRALVGGPSFHRDQFDAATQGIRQPGSAFKPIVYAAAFDGNVCNLANTLDDHKLVYPDSPKDWVVHNYDDRYRGPVSVLEAIRQSINTIAVQVADKTGVPTVQSYGKELGITTPMTPDLPLALGASGVRPIDLCSAFSAFANRGVRFSPFCIQEIHDGQGSITFRDDPAGRLHPEFMRPETVDQINVALREVVLNGTGAAASSVPDAHGKTGTTSSHRDAWFVGYTANLATAVWMAHVQKHQQPGGITAVKYLPMPGATGGSVCAPVWAHFMTRALAVQAAVDRMRGTFAATVQQPEKTALISQLEPAVAKTAVIEASGSEEESAGGSDDGARDGSMAAWATEERRKSEALAGRRGASGSWQGDQPDEGAGSEAPSDIETRYNDSYSVAGGYAN